MYAIAWSLACGRRTGGPTEESATAAGELVPRRSSRTENRAA